MAKSIEWVCEYRECNIVFKRYQCYVDKGIKRYCCQSHSALEQRAKEKDDNKKYQYKERFCKYCNKPFVSVLSTKQRCDECKRIINRVRVIKRESNGVLQEFLPNDYYSMLNKQNNRCAICNIDKCVTGKNFAIDHDHSTGIVRGLLCFSCNHNLGWYENKQKSIENYLKTT